jgi:crotonobetainyl-CoA:carnitine CoA-transferase CaiB-like acyl-CoA transferase
MTTKHGDGILQGVRVLDLGRVLAGPFCAQILGDLGAEIIKVERLDGGDDTRAWKPPEAGGEAAYYFSVNRNKKSLALDLAKPEGRDILISLSRQCDVLVENFRPGVTERLGVDYETISEANPRLVYCSISGFGQTGPMARRPAYDYVIQALSGVMSITGDPNGPPVRCGAAVVDYPTGLWATISILAALMARQQTGRGQHIDLSMMECTLTLMSHMASQYLADGTLPQRVGNGHASIVPMDVYDTADGPLMVLCGNDAMFGRVAQVIGHPEMADDPRFATNPARVENQDAVHAMIGDSLARENRAVWIERFEKASVPVAPIRDFPEVYAAQEVRDRDMVLEMPHPTAGSIRTPGTPLNFSDTPVIESTAPPLLGQHTDTVLQEVLGLDADAVARMKKDGIVG